MPVWDCLLYGDFQKLGVCFWGPHNRHYGIVGFIIIGVPLFRETTMGTTAYAGDHLRPGEIVEAVPTEFAALRKGLVLSGGCHFSPKSILSSSGCE